MEAIDLLLHGALIAASLFYVGPFWRARAGNPAGWPGALLFIAAAAFAALRVLEASDARPIWIVLFQAMAASGPFWFWRLIRALFDDGFCAKPWHWLLLAGLELTATGRFAPEPLGPYALTACRILAAGLVLHAILIMLRGLHDDLMETRQRARIQVGLFAAAMALLTLSRPFLAAAAPVLAHALARATPAIDIALILASGRVLFRVEREVWPQRPARTAPAPDAPDPDAADLETLERLMGQEQVWRESGLTIGKLAARARLPEYRLRRLILERLEARNFTAFIAARRLDEAARRLADPAEARAQITSIAFDCGFASLGPFNRAFRERFGVTPSAYRRGERAPAQNHAPNL